MSVRSAQSITVLFTTRVFATGVGTNADSLPAGSLYLNGTVNGATVTVTNISTGLYKAAVTLPTLAVNDEVEIVIAATVSSVADTAVIWGDTKDVFAGAIPDVIAGGAGGLGIAGTNAATSWASGSHLIGTVDTVTTVTNQLTAAQIATGIWQDTTAGDFTTALSIGKSILNGVTLGTGLTINAYTGNTVQTGDSFARIGAAGASLTAITGVTLAASQPGVTIPTVTTVGTLTTYTGNTPQTGDSYARIGAAGAGLTAITGVTLAASQHVIVDSGTVTTLTNLPAITASWLTATGIASDAITAAKIADGAIDTATFASGTTIPRCTLADTLTTYTGDTPQTGDVYSAVTAATAEPTSPPSSTASILSKILWLFTLGKNKRTQTATTELIRNDADGATIGTSTKSDDGTTFTRGKFL